MKRSSIARRVLAAMIGVVLISTISTVVLYRVLLGPYYYRQQEDILERAADRVDELYEDELDESVRTELNRIGYGINGLILIYGPQGEVRYSSRAMPMRSIVTIDEDTILSLRTYGISAPMNGAGRRGWHGEESAASSLITVERTLANGDRLLLQTAAESLEESVAILTRFALYPALVATLAAIALALVLARRIARPVVELNDLTRRMKNLDFSTRYEGKASDEIGQLGQNFNEMSRTLEGTIAELADANHKLRSDIEREKAIEQARKNFISNVSHELKTPIALIRGYAEGLADGVLEEDRKEDYLHVIIDESEHMSSIVRKLMTLSKLESHHVPTHFEWFDLREAVRHVAQAFAGGAERDGVTLETRLPEEPCQAQADRDMVGSVLSNFVGNAMDHVEPGGTVRITLMDEGPQIRLSVFNSGSSVPPDQAERIWDSFYKLDRARTRAYGGTGLGLAIVKNMVDLHGGGHGVRNVDDGVEFHATFPKGRTDRG